MSRISTQDLPNSGLIKGDESLIGNQDGRTVKFSINDVRQEYEIDALRAVIRQLEYGDGPYPTLDLMFAGATMLDPRIDYTRGSAATGWVNGRLREFGIDEPRLVTDPATGYSGLLLEPVAATNIVEHSLALIERSWSSHFETTPTQNIDGSMTAVKLENISPGVAVFGWNLGTIAPISVTQITKIREDSTSIRGHIRNNTQGIGWASGAYNTETGKVSGTCVSGRYIGDGWYETIFEFSSEDWGIPPEIGDRLWWYFLEGDNSVGVVRELAGLQIEYAPQASSFIPTGASQVTRAGDRFILPTDRFDYRPDRGTLLVDAMVLGRTAGGFVSILGQGTSPSGQRAIRTGWIDSNNNTTLATYVQNGGSSVSTGPLGARVPPGERFILASSWGRTGFVSSARGVVGDVAVQPDGYPNTETLFMAPNDPMIIHRVLYYPERLPDAQLAALTELT